jgi:GNAT superfamily N-acetyltransferase
MVTLDQDEDPEVIAKLHEMSNAAEKDIPTTMPWRALPLEEWKEFWFGNPGTRRDRFWIARDGDRVVGLSLLEFPPTRGLPWTSFTATSRAVRGRGIARALKHQSLAQAIELGYTLVRTMNDGANAPTLHINREMGYEPAPVTLELHRELR